MLESRRLREALAESQAKEAAMEAQEVNLRQQLCSAQSQKRLLHELQQKLCEASALVRAIACVLADVDSSPACAGTCGHDQHFSKRSMPRLRNFVLCIC